MRGGSIVVLVGIVLLVTLPVQAGANCDKAAHAAQAAHKKCDGDAQICLNKMVAKLQEHGWAGIELDRVNGRLTVTQVEADSPASRAGLREGDVLLAMNGVSFEERNESKLKAMKKEMGVGDSLVYTIERRGREKEVGVTLAPIPETVLARWVGNHMLEHATVEIAQH